MRPNLTGILAGTADVDAITLSMARLAQTRSIAVPVAVTTILLGVASNTMVKDGMTVFGGGWSFGRRMAILLGAPLVLGALCLLIIWRL